MGQTGQGKAIIQVKFSSHSAEAGAQETPGHGSKEGEDVNSLRLREGDETAYAPILPLNTSLMV